MSRYSTDLEGDKTVMTGLEDCKANNSASYWLKKQCVVHARILFLVCVGTIGSMAF